MPYDGANDPDIPKNVPEADKAQWVKIWNSTFAECMKGEGAETNACETNAFTTANGVIKKDDEGKKKDDEGKKKASVAIVYPVANDIPSKTLRENLRDLMRRLSQFLFPVERAIGMPDLYAKVQSASFEIPEFKDQWVWLSDIFTENSKLFAIFANNGNLYKTDVNIDADENVTLGTPIKVVVKFDDKKDQTRNMRIVRQADGTQRLFLIMGTTVINRNGFIDSSKLYDSFIVNMDKAEEKPYIDFFHLGKDFAMGEIDWIQRDGAVGIASGILNDSPLSKAFIRSQTEDPEYWGSSISFFPTEKPEKLEVMDGVTIPVYNEGILESIAVLSEKDACSLFTAVLADLEVRSKMDKRVQDALKKLTGEDTELYDSLVSKVDDVNRAITEGNLVHRDTDSSTELLPKPDEVATEPVAEPVTEPVQEPTPEPESQVFELDAEALSQISNSVLESPAFMEFMGGINKAIADATANLTQMSSTLASVQVELATSEARAKAFADEIAVLKVSEEEKKRIWQKDLPAATRGAGVTFRPRTVSAEVDKSKRLDSVAEATLANMK